MNRRGLFQPGKWKTAAGLLGIGLLLGGLVGGLIGVDWRAEAAPGLGGFGGFLRDAGEGGKEDKKIYATKIFRCFLGHFTPFKLLGL